MGTPRTERRMIAPAALDGTDHGVDHSAPAAGVTRQGALLGSFGPSVSIRAMMSTRCHLVGRSTPVLPLDRVALRDPYTGSYSEVRVGRPTERFVAMVLNRVAGAIATVRSWSARIHAWGFVERSTRIHGQPSPPVSRWANDLGSTKLRVLLACDRRAASSSTQLRLVRIDQRRTDPHEGLADRCSWCPTLGPGTMQ